ncbi:hypothetical protein JXB41_02860 [Candidatus Woesearchaeota archaeon]|nr:hypothetical protein [Candidatus Woesearchaeota archaeon]
MKSALNYMIIALLFILSLSFVNATAFEAYPDCVMKCETQEGNFCYPESSECNYIIISGCDISSTGDNDEDLWQNGCDAFPEDNTECLDYDADGVGHNVDCDDYDPLNTSICAEEEEEEVVEEVIIQQEDNDNGGSSGRRGHSSGGQVVWDCRIEDWECTDWSQCENEKQTRTCSKIRACEGEFNKPEEEQSCQVFSTKISEGEEDVLAEPEKEESEEETEGLPDEEEDKKGLGSITGQLFNIPAGQLNTGIVMIFILGVLFLLIFFKKRKKQE